jgi:hypothetical protein
MPYLNDNVLDSGLSWLVTNGTRLDICTAEPATYAEATSTYTKGNKTSLSIGSPGARTPSGRKVTVAAITDGSVTGTDTCGYYGITNGSNTLVAAGALAAGQLVTDGNTFTLTAFDIGIPGPA